MAQTLRQGTAVDVLIGPCVDLTDAATAEPGESPTVKLSKNGQALAAKSDVTTPVHDADGYYNCELDATDTNTVGRLVLTVAASATALPLRHEFQVVEESVYDAMYAASAAGPLQSTTAGRTLKVTATGAAGIDWGHVENQTTAVDLSATDIQLADTVTTLTGHTAQTGDSFARLGAPAGASVSADIVTLGGLFADTATIEAKIDIMDGVVDAILVDTAEIGTAGAGLTNINLPNQTMDITGNLSGSVGSVTGHTAQTGDSFAIVNGAAGLVAIDTVVDAIKVVTDALGASAAANLSLSALSMLTGTVSGTPTSTEVAASGLATSADDILIGRIIIFTSGSAQYEAARITDYVGATDTLTVTTLAVTPAASDTFIIL